MEKYKNVYLTESEVDSCFGIMRVVMWKTLFFYDHVKYTRKNVSQHLAS